MRTPCATLDVYGSGIQAAMYDARVQAGDPESQRWGLSGFYASVVQPGMVRAGDTIALPRLSSAPERQSRRRSVGHFTRT